MKNKVVTIASLRREMNFSKRRDCWRLVVKGEEIDRPLTLAMVEQAINWDNEADFRVRHADEPEAPVETWRNLIQRSTFSLPSRGHTSFYRLPQPPTPPEQKTEAGSTSFEDRLNACEDHQTSMIESIHRVQKQMGEVGQSHVSITEELRAIKEQLQELSDQVCRNQYDIAGIRMDVVGAA